MGFAPNIQEILHLYSPALPLVLENTCIASSFRKQSLYIHAVE